MTTLAQPMDIRLDNNYNKIRDYYKEQLRDCGDYHCDLDEVNGGRDEFVEQEYWLYVMECERVENKHNLLLLNKANNKQHQHHIHINGSDNEQYI